MTLHPSLLHCPGFDDYRKERSDIMLIISKEHRAKLSNNTFQKGT